LQDLSARGTDTGTSNRRHKYDAVPRRHSRNREDRRWFRGLWFSGPTYRDSTEPAQRI